jgi:hypothetical protein
MRNLHNIQFANCSALTLRKLSYNVTRHSLGIILDKSFVRLRRVLRAVPQEPLGSYIGWLEFVLPGIVARVKFKNGESTVLEESAGHVCFVDRDHHVWFTRLQIADLIDP